MPNTRQRLSVSISLNASRLALAAALAGSLLLTGCAAGVTAVDQASTQPQVRANIIYVQAFNASADQVKLDGGMAQKLKTMVSGGSAEGEKTRAALDTREAVSDEIVRKLQSKGLNAVRLDGTAPAGANALIVAGDFEKIDEGQRRRRLLIGLGAGKSEVGAAVQILYKPVNGMPIPLQRFSADADSGHVPGVAETAGVGAVAGHVAMSAAAGTAAHGVTESRHDSISADAKRLADSIATQVAAANATHGWMLPARAEG